MKDYISTDTTRNLDDQIKEFDSIKKVFLNKIDGISVYEVSGKDIRNKVDTDFSGGGHHYVYPWIEDENMAIVEKLPNKKDQENIAKHEVDELKQMRDKNNLYIKAHKKATMKEALRRIHAV